MSLPLPPVNGIFCRFVPGSWVGIVSARVSILGFTFKENVTDTRNTRVIDIIRELEDYRIQVQVHDAMADKSEAQHEYGIALTEQISLLQPAEAVILAVAHKAYVDQGWNLVRSLLKGGRGVVFDINRILDRNAIPEGICLVRL